MTNAAESRENPPRKALKRLEVNTIASFVSGVCQAGLFNPWDRALYLSVKDHRPFLRHENWRAPYQGLSQALVQRTISGGLYFFLQNEMNATMRPSLLKLYGANNENLVSFTVGMSAGIVNGALLNQTAVIKYHTWGTDMSFANSVRDLYRRGGVRVFFKGIRATACRDAVFGSTYEVARSTLRSKIMERKGGDASLITKTESFMMNTVAAGAGTVLSGPFNYVRNVQYAASADIRPPGVMRTLGHLKSKSQNHMSVFRQLSFIQERLRLGWGTLRVAVGMAFGQFTADTIRAALLDEDEG